MTTRTETLHRVRKGEQIVIRTLPAENALRSQCIRLGLSIGASVSCIERLPGGTIVIESGRQEIALGRKLAEQIGIQRSGDESP